MQIVSEIIDSYSKKTNGKRERERERGREEMFYRDTNHVKLDTS